MIVDVDIEVQQTYLLASTMSNFNEDPNAPENTQTDFETRDILYASSRMSLSEYNNPELFLGLFPILFPCGFGGIDDARMWRIGMEMHIKHLIEGSNKRFQTHRAFMFVAFNILN